MSIKGRIAKDIVEWAAEHARPLIEDVTELFAARPSKQLSLFPGYNKAHQQKRLEQFAAKSVVRPPQMTSRETTKRPLKRLYHATKNDFNAFEVGRPTTNSTTLGPYETERHAAFFAEDPAFAQDYITDAQGRIAPGGQIMPVYVNARNPFPLDDNSLSALLDDGGLMDQLRANNVNADNIYRWYHEPERWALFDGEEGRDFVNGLRSTGFDSAFLREQHPAGGLADVWAVFDPRQIKSASGNRGSFDPLDPDIAKAKGGLIVKRRRKKL